MTTDPTTDTTPTPMTLTQADVAAMRAATSYVVRLDGATARLELTKTVRVKPTDGFSADSDGFGRTNVDLTRTIAGTAGSLTRATFVELYVSGAWTALAHLVRAGDVLKFYAADDNSNGYLRAAVIPAGAMEDSTYHRHGYSRLYVDELRVDVLRKGRNPLRGLLLTYSICPNNSARAVAS